jgi:hypothetical protein
MSATVTGHDSRSGECGRFVKRGGGRPFMDVKMKGGRGGQYPITALRRLNQHACRPMPCPRLPSASCKPQAHHRGVNLNHATVSRISFHSAPAVPRLRVTPRLFVSQTCMFALSPSIPGLVVQPLKGLLRCAHPFSFQHTLSSPASLPNFQ